MKRWMMALAMAALPVCAAAAQEMKPQFEVVSIKAHDPSDHSMRFMFSEAEYNVSGVPLTRLVQMGYGFGQNEDVVGLPAAVKEARYDIRAKLDAETQAEVKKLPREKRQAVQKMLVRQLLEERFKMQAHTVEKEGAVYELVLAKGGVKMRAADDKAASTITKERVEEGKSRPTAIRMGNGELSAEGVTTTQLASMLQQQLDRKVIDKTGLTGRYDVELKWSREDGSGSEGAPLIFTALQEQTGLKLESGRGPVTSIVIDHAELPVTD